MIVKLQIRYWFFKYKRWLEEIHLPVIGHAGEWRNNFYDFATSNKIWRL